MKKITALFTTLILTTAIAMDPYVKESSNKDSAFKILMIGDSITVSNCQKNSNGLCGWRKFLPSKCDMTDQDYSIDTISKVGISTYQANKSFPNSYANIKTPFISRNKYDAVFVALGINDIGDGSGSIEQLKKSYTSLLNKIELISPKQIFLILPFPNCKYGNLRPKVAGRIKEFRSFLQTTIDTHSFTSELTLIDIYDELVELKQFNGKELECLNSEIKSSDNLHPKNDDKTQERLATEIINKILEGTDTSIMCGQKNNLGRAPSSEGTECDQHVDTILIGDSQMGATWSKSYLGNFLQECLEGDFIIYGRGGTVLGNWLSAGGQDQIQTVERSPEYNHKIIGKGNVVPKCKTRISHMLQQQTPNRFILEFGDNYFGGSDTSIKKHVGQLIIEIDKYNLSKENCYFITPTFEMAVSLKRNVPRKTLKNSEHVRNIITETLGNRCNIIDGLKLMKDSTLLSNNMLLKRINVPGKNGCTGGASNDNIHVCGEAAKEYASKICHILNND